MKATYILLAWLTEDPLPDYDRDEVINPGSPAWLFVVLAVALFFVVYGIKIARESSAVERRRRAEMASRGNR